MGGEMSLTKQDQAAERVIRQFECMCDADLSLADMQWLRRAINTVEREAERRGFCAALAKVANDWRERGFRTHDEIQSIEVQAFLDSRHVHYPEAWPDTHPQKRQASRPKGEE
jgi:hypothetical protein